jgi:hypothetical protein
MDVDTAAQTHVAARAAALASRAVATTHAGGVPVAPEQTLEPMSGDWRVPRWQSPNFTNFASQEALDGDATKFMIRAVTLSSAKGGGQVSSTVWVCKGEDFLRS